MLHRKELYFLNVYAGFPDQIQFLDHEYQKRQYLIHQKGSMTMYSFNYYIKEKYIPKKAIRKR